MNSIGRVLSAGFLIFGLAACQTTSEKAGSGPIQLSPASYETYQEYLDRSPLVFAVTEDGQDTFYIYCGEVGCDPYRNVDLVLERCAARYEKTCRLWAIRDEIVWENPGDWAPSDTDLQAYRDTPRESWSEQHAAQYEERVHRLAGERKDFALYQAAPGHKAYVLWAGSLQDRLWRIGYAFGHSSAEEAAKTAHRFCARNSPGNQGYFSCEVYEVNGVRLWPKHIDEVSDEEWAELDKAGADLPPYEGVRPVVVSWDGLEDQRARAKYSMTTGVIRFAFDHSGFEDACAGEVVVASDQDELSFSMRCGLEISVTGTGSYNSAGTEAVLSGMDGEGRDVQIRVGPDPRLAPS